MHWLKQTISGQSIILIVEQPRLIVEQPRLIVEQPRLVVEQPMGLVRSNQCFG